MSVIVVIELTAKDGHLEPAIQQLHEILPDTRAYDGCLFLRMSVFGSKNMVELCEE
jgi:quinol monooxygenase YgiN